MNKLTAFIGLFVVTAIASAYAHSPPAKPKQPAKVVCACQSGGECTCGKDCQCGSSKKIAALEFVMAEMEAQHKDLQAEHVSVCAAFEARIKAIEDLQKKNNEWANKLVAWLNARLPVPQSPTPTSTPASATVAVDTRQPTPAIPTDPNQCYIDPATGQKICPLNGRVIEQPQPEYRIWRWRR